MRSDHDPLLALRAQRQEPHLSQQEPHLSQSEKGLLLQVNEGISAETQQRFDKLVAKRQADTITPEELAELIQLTDQGRAAHRTPDAPTVAVWRAIGSRLDVAAREHHGR